MLNYRLQLYEDCWEFAVYSFQSFDTGGWTFDGMLLEKHLKVHLLVTAVPYAL